jgi:hypothetical protein
MYVNRLIAVEAIEEDPVGSRDILDSQHPTGSRLLSTVLKKPSKFTSALQCLQAT